MALALCAGKCQPYDLRKCQRDALPDLYSAFFNHVSNSFKQNNQSSNKLVSTRSLIRFSQRTGKMKRPNAPFHLPGSWTHGHMSCSVFPLRPTDFPKKQLKDISPGDKTASKRPATRGR